MDIRLIQVFVILFFYSFCSSSILKSEEKKSFNVNTVLKDLENEIKKQNIFLEEDKKDNFITPIESEKFIQQIYSCLVIPENVIVANPNQNIEIFIEMNRDRTINQSLIVDQNRYATDKDFKIAADIALNSINSPSCSPLALPLGKYEQWKEIIINFDYSYTDQVNPLNIQDDAEIVIAEKKKEEEKQKQKLEEEKRKKEEDRKKEEERIASDNLEDFLSGKKIAWFMWDDKIKDIPSYKNCNKLYKNTDGLIYNIYIKNDYSHTHFIWGEKTKKSTIEKFPIQIDTEKGNLTKRLITNIEHIPHGVLIKYITDDRNMELEISKKNENDNFYYMHEARYANPTKKEKENREALKKAVGWENKKLFFCYIDNYEKNISKIEDLDYKKENKNRDSALNYVLNKKWTMFGLNCKKDGGTYQVFKKDHPIGIEYVFGKKPTKIGEGNGSNHTFKDLGPDEFELFQEIQPNGGLSVQYCSGYPAMEREYKVKLLSNDKIEIKQTYCKELNVDALFNGKCVYKICKEKDKKEMLCDNQ